MTKSRKRRLGRGLDALLGEGSPGPDEDQMLKNVPIDLLQRGKYQPRTRMDKSALEELSQSIKNRGMVQPIVVRPLPDGSYEIIAGERRWRAAQLAGLDDVPVVVRDIPDEAALVTALIENIQREDLNPIEEAAGIKRLLEEFGLTHEQAAVGVGRSRSAVTNLLRLLTLGTKARELLETGQIEMGHARALLALSVGEQDALAAQIAAGGLSVRQAEVLVRRKQAKPEPQKTRNPQPGADIRDLQDKLSEKLGSRVTVRDTRGKGRIIIEYNSLDELDGILEHIR
ncbi:ParB/RepB/Spo0J family partition protein [Pseudomonadota bacterium]